VNSFILSNSGSSSGVGFAIPAAVVRRVVETAVGGGRVVVRPWLGARTQSVTPELARTLGLPTPQGALVADLWPGGPAARAGLRQGDVVLEADGRPVPDVGTLSYAISNHRPGEDVPLKIRRADGHDQVVQLHAEAPPAVPAKDERTIAGANPFSGATVVNLSPAVADELGLDTYVASGVMVTGISRGYAGAWGLRPGDIVRAVNGQQISTTRDLAGAAATQPRQWQITVERNGQRQTVVLNA
jgi:S1-C subfamily serine protease